MRLLRVVKWCLLLGLLDNCSGSPVESLTVEDKAMGNSAQIEFPAFCVLTEGRFLQRFDGATRTLPTVGGETVTSLCSDPNQFHVTVTITGSYENKTAHLFLTVKDGTRVVKANLRQQQDFQYNSYNDGGYDCLSMAGVQTVVRNFGESLVIETGFASIIVNRDLKLETYMVQNPRSPLCGTCGYVPDMSEVCSKQVLILEPMSAGLKDDGNEAVNSGNDKEADDHLVHWSYDMHGEGGPDHWSQLDAEKVACDVTRSFSRQSPINIETGTTKLDPAAPVPHYTITNPYAQGKLVNSGHAPSLTPVNASYILKNVPYSLEEYTLLGLRIHFGPNSNSGSEHTVNGKTYSGEIHFVNYNTRYGGLREALKHSDGLAVIGVFLEVSDGPPGASNNEELSRVLDHLDAISNKDNEAFLPVDMSKILPTESDLSSYYTYDGSLTTPGCDEIVRWIVLSRPWGMTERQLSALRLLRTGGNESEPMAVHGNYRPVAPLNRRTIIRREPGLHTEPLVPGEPGLYMEPLVPGRRM
ncbi:uncharacterized protein LOC135477810 [Liolophura sinensis]|uniref:uncharacterized protein LOC135477810 n=1 Tax=Liolophura sinensis TaxID=3198878 RepID=UPI003158E308